MKMLFQVSIILNSCMNCYTKQDLVDYVNMVLNKRKNIQNLENRLAKS